jgi:hypothetical protein
LWVFLTFFEIFVDFKMVALEEFNNHLVAVIGFLTAVAWIAYKLDWFKRLSLKKCKENLGERSLAKEDRKKTSWVARNH